MMHIGSLFLRDEMMKIFPWGKETAESLDEYLQLLHCQGGRLNVHSALWCVSL